MVKKNNSREAQQQALSRTLAFMKGETIEEESPKPISENSLYKKQDKAAKPERKQPKEVFKEVVVEYKLPDIMPIVVDRTDVAFGAGAGLIRKLLPAYDSIPDEFKDHWNPYAKLQSEWFFKGLKRSKLRVKPGINEKLALMHLAAIQGSWEPKHEHKAAGVAYLMSLWFDIA